MDIEPEVFLKVDKVIVDDWDQSNREKKVINVLVEDGLFSREKLHAELGDIIIGHKTVVNTKMKSFCSTMGMAIDDIVCAKWFFNAAQEQNVGTVLPLL